MEPDWAINKVDKDEFYGTKFKKVSIIFQTCLQGHFLPFV